MLRFYWNIPNSFPRLIWPRMDWFDGVFWWYMSRFDDFISAATKICKNCSIVFVFRRPQIFSAVSLRVFLICSLNVPVLLAIRISNLGLWALAMQLNFLSYIRVSSSGLFTASFDERTNITSKNYIVHFLNCFYVKGPLMFYAVYRNSCALKDVIGASFCTCSLLDQRMSQMSFWPAKPRQKWFFFRSVLVFDLVLKYCSDINESNWLQLLLCFPVLMSIVASSSGISFFRVFQLLVWSFLLMHFYGNVCIWFPKLIWSRMDWFWIFVWSWLFPLISYLHGLKSETNAQIRFGFKDIKSFFR